MKVIVFLFLAGLVFGLIVLLSRLFSSRSGNYQSNSDASYPVGDISRSDDDRITGTDHLHRHEDSNPHTTDAMSDSDQQASADTTASDAGGSDGGGDGGSE